MLKKLLLSTLLVGTFSFAQTSAEQKIIDTADKAVVNEIEQKIIKEKFDEAQKELEAKKARELAEKKARELDMQNLAQINVILGKIKKIDLQLKDNILLKRYSNYLSYRKISTELALYKRSLVKKKKTASEEQLYQLHNKIKVKENRIY